MNIFKKIFIAPVKLYQRCISPLFPPSCRFTPTCSQYCIEAIEEWGVVRGLALGIWRILRCNPWGKGGEDPVPVNRRRREKQEKKKERNN